MAGVVLNGSTSGSVTLDPPAVAGSTVITLPSTSGTMAKLTDIPAAQWTTTGSDIYYSTGNVGIGNSSMGSFPAAMRQLVVGSGSGNQGMTIYAGPTSYSAYLAFKSAADTTTQGLIYYDFSNNNLVSYANGILATTIKATGQKIVGNTSTAVGAGWLSLYYDGQNYNGLTTRTSTAGTYYGAMFKNVSDAFVGNISVSASATAYNTSSDYRLKDNVAPMTGALARVALLKPVTYSWKIDGSAGEGFIAHELQEVCPLAVTGEKDAVNEDGSVKSQSIDVSFLVATLTAAIQEQQALIENLTTRLSALENK